MSPRTSAARRRPAPRGLAPGSGPGQLARGPDRASASIGRCRRSRPPPRATGTSTRPVPQPSSRTRPAGPGRQAPPEGDVAPADGAGVLPVVEGRVLVPAVPALSHGARASRAAATAGAVQAAGPGPRLRDGDDQHGALDLEERRTGLVRLAGVAIERGDEGAAGVGRRGVAGRLHRGRDRGAPLVPDAGDRRADARLRHRHQVHGEHLEAGRPHQARHARADRAVGVVASRPLRGANRTRRRGRTPRGQRRAR